MTHHNSNIELCYNFVIGALSLILTSLDFNFIIDEIEKTLKIIVLLVTIYTLLKPRKPKKPNNNDNQVHVDFT